MDKLLAIMLLLGLAVVVPLGIADAYFDFSGIQAAHRAKEQARIERHEERAARLRAFDEQVAHESKLDAAKRRVHFWSNIENDVERLAQ